jgi:hypothetical protein
VTKVPRDGFFSDGTGAGLKSPEDFPHPPQEFSLFQSEITEWEPWVFIEVEGK